MYYTLTNSSSFPRKEYSLAYWFKIPIKELCNQIRATKANAKNAKNSKAQNFKKSGEPLELNNFFQHFNTILC